MAVRERAYMERLIPETDLVVESPRADLVEELPFHAQLATFQFYKKK